VTVSPVRPEWLDRRDDGATPGAWRSKDAPPIAAATRVDVEAGRIEASRLDSPLGRTLRTMSLVRARYDVVGEWRTYAARSVGRSSRHVETALDVAQLWRAQALTERALDGAHEWDVDYAKLVASRLDQMQPIDATVAALEHLRTPGARSVLRAIGAKHPRLRDALQALRDHVAGVVDRLPREPEYDADVLAYVAREVVKLLENVPALAEQPGPTENERPGGAPPPLEDGRELWVAARPASTRLDVAHRGKIGARRRPSSTGSKIGKMSRLLTDPDRRVFTTKQRAVDALLVLDLSGSMSWSTDELDEVIEAARGAVVVGYSATDRGDDPRPNVWLLAKDGRRVRELPDVPGGNGCDGTALEYAVKRYRRRAGMPVLWVSDGQVTGRTRSTVALAHDMVARLRRHRVTQVQNATDAIETLRAMSRGQRPQPRVGRYLERCVEQVA